MAALPPDLNEPLSSIGISEATGYPDSTIRMWSREETFPAPAKTVEHRSYYYLTDVMHWITRRRSETTKQMREEKMRVDLDTAKAKLQLAQARAQAQEIKNQSATKDLINMEQARAMFLKTMSEFMLQLDNLHGRLAPELATMDDANDCADAIKKEIRRIREQVSDIIADT